MAALTEEESQGDERKTQRIQLLCPGMEMEVKTIYFSSQNPG